MLLMKMAVECLFPVEEGEKTNESTNKSLAFASHN